MTNLLQFHNKCSKNPTVSLNTLRNSWASYRVFFVWVDPHLSLCWQQHSKCERAIRQFAWFIHLSFVHLTTRPSKQKSKGVMSGNCISCISLTFTTKPTCWHQLFSHNDVYYLPKELPCSWFALSEDSTVLYKPSVPYKISFTQYNPPATLYQPSLPYVATFYAV